VEPVVCDPGRICRRRCHVRRRTAAGATSRRNALACGTARETWVDQRRQPDHAGQPGQGGLPGIDATRAVRNRVTFSAETGTLLRTLNHILARGGYQQVLWASPSAQLLIVSGTQPGPTVGSFNLGHSAGILSDDRFTPIPWSNRTFAGAWQH
jgi:hypothetical protein